MESFGALLAMGGYAAFVWPAYGISLAVLVGVLLVSRAQLRSRETELEKLQGTRRERRRGSGGTA